MDYLLALSLHAGSGLLVEGEEVSEQAWTVVRFPNGSWSYGGKPNDPDYEQCEKFIIIEKDPKKAVAKARARRAYLMKKEKESGK